MKKSFMRCVIEIHTRSESSNSLDWAPFKTSGQEHLDIQTRRCAEMQKKATCVEHMLARITMSEG